MLQEVVDLDRLKLGAPHWGQPRRAPTPLNHRGSIPEAAKNSRADAGAIWDCAHFGRVMQVTRKSVEALSDRARVRPKGRRIFQRREEAPMATEDQTPSYYMVEDNDSIDTQMAERINEFNWDPDAAGAVMALFPVDWAGCEGELVTLRQDGTVAIDIDGTFALPEPFDRGTHSTMITTTTGMAVLKPDHPANQMVESGFQAVGVPVPEVVRALNAREAALTGDRAAIRAYTSEALGRWSGWSEPISTALLGNWADPLHNEGRLSPVPWPCSWPRPASSTSNSSRSGTVRPTGSTCDCSTPRSATG